MRGQNGDGAECRAWYGAVANCIVGRCRNGVIQCDVSEREPGVVTDLSLAELSVVPGFSWFE